MTVIPQACPVDHLDKMRRCRWSDYDGQWHCQSPGALNTMREEGFVDCFCLNPKIVPCPDWEEARYEAAP